MKSFLVVDDEHEVRGLLVAFLKDRGFEPTEAEDGAGALKIARRRKPNIVLLDINLPDMSGIEVLETLRREMPECAVVMISGQEDEQVALKALELGAHDYIQKPFDMAYLERVLLAKLALSDDR